jgi:hypothetical protein
LRPFFCAWKERESLIGRHRGATFPGCGSVDQDWDDRQFFGSRISQIVFTAFPARAVLDYSLQHGASLPKRFAKTFWQRGAV